jgi:hypothetical protein
MSFSHRIQITEEFNPEFSFNRIYTVNGVRYYISVFDRKQQAYYFNMQSQGNQWKIINAPKLPNWILNAERELESAILSNME